MKRVEFGICGLDTTISPKDLTSLFQVPKRGTEKKRGSRKISKETYINICAGSKLPLFPYNMGMVINPIVVVYIPIIRIPYQGLDDHPQYKEFTP